jgi:hypothetical protein
MNRRQATLFAAVSSCAAALLVGGIAWAAIPGEGGVINACYGKVGGVVRVIDTAKREKCVAGLEVPFSWNQQGPKGDPGIPGRDGEDGAEGVDPTVTQLEANDANCPAGGVAITDAAGHTGYVCSAQPFSGTFTSPSGEYSISVTDDGITMSRGNTAAVSIAGQDIAIVAERDATITIGRNLATSVSGADHTTVGSNAVTTIGGGLSTSISGSNLTAIGANSDTTINGNASTSIGGAASETVGANLSIDVGGNTLLDTAQDLNVTAGDDTQILSGGTAIVQSVGTLTLHGSTVNLN